MASHPVYPVGLLLSGRRCLVVGGGKVAARKIRGLVECGAAVTVIAPEVHEAVGALASEGVLAQMDAPPIEIELREYRDGEAEQFDLVLSATGDPAVDGRVDRDATGAKIWSNCADDLERCSFVLPAVLRDGPVTVSVSTSGSSPALASWLRDRLADTLGEGIGDLAELLAEGRQDLKTRGVPSSVVDWRRILDGPLPGLVAEGRVEEARAHLRSTLAEMLSEQGL